jgi:hypothetical protein
MRAYIKREQNVLEIPEDFATLVKIDSNLSEGSYHYKFEYLVNPEKAFRNNAILVEMFVSKEPWAVRTYNIFNKFDAEETIVNIRLKNQRQKDFYRSADLAKDNKVWIPYITSDITKFISNTQVAKFSRGRRISDSEVFKPIVSTRTLVKPVLVSELALRNTAMPILEVNTSKRRNEFGIDGSSVDSSELRHRASNVLFQRKIDPASFVGRRSNTITSAKNSYSGVIPKKNGSGDIHNDDEVLITSLLKNNQTNSDADKNSTDYQNVPVVETNTNIVVEETMSIPISYLDSDEFYVVFRLKNKRGVIIETVSGLVSHGKQVSLMRIPAIPPVIVTPPKSSLGGTTINLKQVDPSGTSIRLYRKYFSTLESLKDSTYSLVGEVKCGIADGFVKIFDYPNSLDPVIYRAVSVNSNGLIGSEFSSAVVENIRGSVAKTSPKNQKPNFVTISTTVLPSGITVKLSNFPSGPIAFELRRRDLTLKENAYTCVNPPTLLDVLQSSQVTIEDTTGLQSRHIYEYAVFLIYKTGEVKQSATRHIVNYKTSVSNIVSLDISPADIEQSGGNEIDVKFSITKNVSQNSADQIKNFLTKQGFLGEFQEDIIANRDRLGNLFAIGVTRHNLSTGQVEDFGILENDDDFSDIAAGSTAGVSALVPGNEYKYVVTAYSRNIESLLPNLVKTDSTNQNLPYTFTPAEWTHPITLEDGNVITEQSLKRNHSSKSFTFGTIADVKEFQVSLSEVLPALYDGKAKFLPGRKSVLVQWKIQGNVNKIDHFIIVLDILGMKTIVGKTHNVSNSNYFQFLDNLDNQESGGLTYFIVPVYFDYSRGVELKTNQVVV